MARPYFNAIILLIGILTLVQSITWFILALLGILSYRCQMTTPAFDEESNRFTALLYYLYFQGVGCEIDETTIDVKVVAIKKNAFGDPAYINGFMVAYLTFNIFYFFFAIGFLINRKMGSENFSRRLMRGWSLNTLAILILDLWLTIVFGIDYGFARKEADVALGGTVPVPIEWAPSVPGALMAIAAKGFILWIVNFVFFWYIVPFTADWKWIFSCYERALDDRRPRRQQGYPQRSNENYGYDGSIPRLTPNDPNSMALVPVSEADRWNQPRYPPRPHPNAVEGVTSFNDQFHEPPRGRNIKFGDEQWERDDNFRRESHDVRRPVEDPPSNYRETGRPNVRNVFNGPDRRNFTQGPGDGNSRPYGIPTKAKTNEFFY